MKKQTRNLFGLKIAMFALSALALGACASKELLLPQSEMTPFPAASERTPVRTGLNFQIQGAQDQRAQDPHQLGWTSEDQDGRIPIVTERTVAETVQDRVTRELTDRGFKPGIPADVLMTVTIRKLDLQSVVNGPFRTPACDADMTFDITRTGTKRTAQVKVNSTFTAPAPLFKKQMANSQTVASCLNLVTERLVQNEAFQKMIQ